MSLNWKIGVLGRDILGKKRFCKWQSKLKYFLNFRKYYYDGKVFEPLRKRKEVVFFIDGRTTHGGLSDRLRGLFSVYYYCRKRSYDFKVCWTYPFKLQDYFVPATFDWVVTPEQINHNRREVAFRFFNSYSFMNNDEKSYFELLDSEKPILHVYSNVTLHEELFKDMFSELFKPALALEHAVSQCLRKLNGGGKYVSITFRFIGILGDFKDKDKSYGELTDEKKKVYIKKCLSVCEKLHNEHNGMLLVTSDSPVFLAEVQKLDFVYVIPGKVVHMDNVSNDNYQLHLKSFLDMMMISKAEKCYSYCYGRMFRDSKFARTSALIGGRPFEDIIEEEEN